jgi:hypothetical protein
MTDERFQHVVAVLGVSDAAAAVFGLTPEQAEAHRQALRLSMTLGAAAFIALVDSETKAAEQASEPLTAAEQLRLEARRAVAIAIEEFLRFEVLQRYDGPVQ